MKLWIKTCCLASILLLFLNACQTEKTKSPTSVVEKEKVNTQNKPFPKWVITHSMGMMPATTGWGLNGLYPENKFALTRPKTHWTSHYGGQYRMLPLSAFHTVLKKDGSFNVAEDLRYLNRVNEAKYPKYINDKYRWDLEWAERIGIDGFGILLSKNERSRQFAVGWFKAMEQMLKEKPDTNLRITFMFSGHEVKKGSSPFKWLKEFCEEKKSSPAWLRHNGKVVIKGYRSMATWSAKEGATVEQAKKAVAINKEFLDSLGLGETIFLFDGTEFMPKGYHDKMAEGRPDYLGDVATEVCKTFDAYMVWGGIIPDATYQANYPYIARAVNKSRKAWGMPIINIHSGIGQFYISKPGVERLLDTWDMAEKTNAQFVQIVTWNDANEATSMLPSTGTNYAFTMLNKHLIHRFKHGEFPEFKEDKVYMFYRKYHENVDPALYPRATVSNTVNRWGWTDDMLHVIVFAPEKGTVKITGTDKGEQTFKVKKGFNEFKVKTAINQEIATRVYRKGKLAHELISPERVTDKPFREDLVPWGWSSDCRKYYAMDFGKEFYPISEYSQRYNDGLPDWFRLLYFGTTDRLAESEPDADPDSDGVTNLEEYQLGEHPMKKNPVYKAGYVWDEISKALSRVDPKKQNHTKRNNLNHYPDKHGKLVHGFLYTKNNDHNFDGDYPYMNKWNNNKNIGWSLRDWSKFHIGPADNGGMEISFIPKYTAIYRFWSPVGGSFKIIAGVNTPEKVALRIQKGSEVIKEIMIDNKQSVELDLKLSRHDKLDFILVPQGATSFQATFKPEITLTK